MNRFRATGETGIGAQLCGQRRFHVKRVEWCERILVQISTLADVDVDNQGRYVWGRT